HVAYVAFVVGGLAAIASGGWRGWDWVRNPWFRSVHLAMIAVVVIESWAAVACPLTTLENGVGMSNGQKPTAGSGRGFRYARSAPNHALRHRALRVVPMAGGLLTPRSELEVEDWHTTGHGRRDESP